MIKNIFMLVISALLVSFSALLFTGCDGLITKPEKQEVFARVEQVNNTTVKVETGFIATLDDAGRSIYKFVGDGQEITTDVVSATIIASKYHGDAKQTEKPVILNPAELEGKIVKITLIGNKATIVEAYYNVTVKQD